MLELLQILLAPWATNKLWQVEDLSREHLGLNQREHQVKTLTIISNKTGMVLVTANAMSIDWSLAVWKLETNLVQVRTEFCKDLVRTGKQQITSTTKTSYTILYSNKGMLMGRHDLVPWWACNMSQLIIQILHLNAHTVSRKLKDQSTLIESLISFHKPILMTIRLKEVNSKMKRVSWVLKKKINH